MNKKEKVFVGFFFIIGVLMSGIIAYSFFPRTVEISCEPIVINNTNTIKEIIEMEKTPDYLIIAENISDSHTYDINDYNCWDFATDLKKALIENDYQAEISCGFYKGKTHHAWVTLKIPIEATTGEVIPTDVFKEDYSGGYKCSDKYRG